MKNQIPQIGIDTNVQKIEIVRNGQSAGFISFSLSDPALLSRLREVSKKADAIQESSKLAEGGDIDMQLEEAVRIDAEMRELLDWAFGAPVADTVFGDSFCFTTSGGITAMEQFLSGVMPYIEAAFKGELAAAQERRDKYLSKYRK